MWGWPAVLHPLCLEDLLLLLVGQLMVQDTSFLKDTADLNVLAEGCCL